MEVESALLEALHQDPSDDAARLALADWLDEQGEPARAAQAEALRLHVALRREPGSPSFEGREARLHALLASGVVPCVPERTNSLGMRFALIPPGTFLMGSPDDEANRGADEGPVREVEITRAFYLGVHPVTQQQFRKVTRRNPSLFSPRGDYGARVAGLDTGAFPVENITWRVAAGFCRRLAALPAEQAAGRAYRLPTEAEWEYACRGAYRSQAPFHTGHSLSSARANFDGRHPHSAPQGPNLQRTSAVGSYPPNVLGLYDLHGNVYEWCNDTYETGYYAAGPRRDPPGPSGGAARVSLGGCWINRSERCRAAFRNDLDEPHARGAGIGVRVVLVPGGAAPPGA
jgi:uncharacterized protein (TIGR02996 family)